MVSLKAISPKQPKYILLLLRTNLNFITNNNYLKLNLVLFIAKFSSLF